MGYQPVRFPLCGYHLNKMLGLAMGIEAVTLTARSRPIMAPTDFYILVRNLDDLDVATRHHVLLTDFDCVIHIP